MAKKKSVKKDVIAETALSGLDTIKQYQNVILAGLIILALIAAFLIWQTEKAKRQNQAALAELADAKEAKEYGELLKKYRSEAGGEEDES